MLMIYLSAFDSDDDKQTFEDIYLRYKDIAFRAALKVSNNHALAEDALHNGFMQIINDWDKFLQIPCDKRRSRIVIIVKNKMIDLLRKEAKYVISDEEEDYPDTFDYTAIIEHKEESHFLRECVAGLPDIYKIVLELKYYHDMSNSEIADMLGIKPHNAAVRASRAIELLAKTVRGSE